MSQPSPGPETLVGKTRGGIPTEDWSMETKTENRRFSHSILKNRYTYWGEPVK